MPKIPIIPPEVEEEWVPAYRDCGCITCYRAGQYGYDNGLVAPHEHVLVCAYCGESRLHCTGEICTACRRCGRYHYGAPLNRPCTSCGACGCSGPCASCGRCFCDGPCDGCGGCNCDGPCQYCRSCDCDGSTCEESPYRRPFPIHGYSYRPMLEFHGAGPLYLGMELEMEISGSFAKPLKIVRDHIGDLVFLKEDGSISNGFEMVTHPMDWTFAHTMFPWQALPMLADAGAYTRDYENGIHVHLSRAGFTGPVHVFSWMKFLHRNQGNVIRIARRDSSQWAAWHRETRRHQKYLAKPELQRNAYNAPQRNRYGDPVWRVEAEGRYQAINTTNPHTFELRVFAASLAPQEVKAAMALASSSVEYTRTLTTQQILADRWSWASYVDYLKTVDSYAPLTKEIDRLCAS